MISKLLSLLKERSFIIYAFIGISGVVIDFIIYYVLVKLSVPPVVASAVSVSVGIINNFFLNAHFNFKRKDHLFIRFLSFYAVGATGLILSALLIILLHDIYGLGAVGAKLLTIAPIVLYQYWFNKNASFAVDHKQVPWKQLAVFAASVAVISIFAINAPYFNFTDEADNLLGGQFIASGQGAIYKDYFSHHMPLTYYVAAPLFLFFSTNLIAVKVSFGLVMSLWLLMMGRHLYKKFGLKTFILFTGLVAISQMLTWSHMLLAESLIAFAIVHAIILFTTREHNRSFASETATYSLLGSIPILSSLAYAPLSVVIYGLFFATLATKHQTARQTMRKLLIGGIIFALPYLLFIASLFIGHSGTEFREQAISFNTHYYSQYLPDAAISPVDGLLTIIQGSTSSLAKSLTPAGGQTEARLLVSLFALSTICSIYVLFKSRQKLLAIFIGMALFISSSREGFLSVFANNNQARTGVIVAFIGTLTIVLAIFYLRNSLAKDRVRLPILTLLCFTLLFLGLNSASTFSTTARSYLREESTLLPGEQPGSPATVINYVNHSSDYYWVGPIDFSSQLIINSKNASKYRFFAPWHAACPKCKAEFYEDLRRTSPKVIALDPSLSIWGHQPVDYAPELIDMLEEDYYQLPDIRLKGFYFIKGSAAEINNTLKMKGYEI